MGVFRILQIDPLLTISAICPKVTQGQKAVIKQLAGSSQQWQIPVDHDEALAAAPRKGEIWEGGGKFMGAVGYPAGASFGLP